MEAPSLFWGAGPCRDTGTAPYTGAMPLNARQQAFVAEYIKDGNGTKAAIRARLKARQEAGKADWLAFQEAKKLGQPWPPEDQEAPR